jgi:hypothetical protein
VVASAPAPPARSLRRKRLVLWVSVMMSPFLRY